MQPYNPQSPASPETFAGRHEMRAYVRVALEAAKKLRGSAMLLYGYRGSGKTSALRKVEAMVRDSLSNAVVIEVPLRVPSSEGMLIHAVGEAVRKALLRRTHLSDRVKRAIQRPAPSTTTD